MKINISIHVDVVLINPKLLVVKLKTKRTKFSENINIIQNSSFFMKCGIYEDYWNTNTSK